MTHVNSRGKLQAKRKDVSRKDDWDRVLATVRKLKKSAAQGNDDAMVVIGDNMVIIRTKKIPGNPNSSDKKSEDYTVIKYKPLLEDDSATSHVLKDSATGAGVKYHKKMSDLSGKSASRELQDRANHDHFASIPKVSIKYPDAIQYKGVPSGFDNRAQKHLESYFSYHKDLERKFKGVIWQKDVNYYRQLADVLNNETSSSLQNSHVNYADIVRAVNEVSGQEEANNYKVLLEAFNKQVRQHLQNSKADRERIVRTLKESPSPEALDFYHSITKG